jgi:hypothetical protein
LKVANQADKSQPNFYATGEIKKPSEQSSHTSQKSVRRVENDEASQQTLISNSTEGTGNTTTAKEKRGRNLRNLRGAVTDDLSQERPQTKLNS